MKFNCGLLPDEKLALAKKRSVALGTARAEWHDWFAWHPVKVASGDCRWLEVIERKIPGWVNHYGGWDTEGSIYVRAKEPA